MNTCRPYLNFSLTSDGPEAIKNQPIYALVAILILFTAVFIMLCRQLWTARDEGQLLLVIGGYTVALVTYVWGPPPSCLCLLCLSRRLKG